MLSINKRLLSFKLVFFSVLRDKYAISHTLQQSFRAHFAWQMLELPRPGRMNMPTIDKNIRLFQDRGLHWPGADPKPQTEPELLQGLTFSGLDPTRVKLFVPACLSRAKFIKICPA